MTDLRRFKITRIDGRFYLTGARGATYVATPAFIRGRDGREVHVSRFALQEFSS